MDLTAWADQSQSWLVSGPWLDGGREESKHGLTDGNTKLYLPL